MNLQIAFGRIVIFTILILPTQGHGIALHLFMSSLICFISAYRFCILFFCLLRYVFPEYFILFVAMVNGIDSLISCSDFSLLVYRNASYFCVFILYPVTLLCSQISYSNSLIVPLGLSLYNSMPSTNSFISSFLTYH